MCVVCGWLLVINPRLSSSRLMLLIGLKLLVRVRICTSSLRPFGGCGEHVI